MTHHLAPPELMARRQAEFLASLGDSFHPSFVRDRKEGKERERERERGELEKVPSETKRTNELSSGAKK